METFVCEDDVRLEADSEERTLSTFGGSSHREHQTQRSRAKLPRVPEPSYPLGLTTNARSRVVPSALELLYAFADNMTTKDDRILGIIAIRAIYTYFEHLDTDIGNFRPGVMKRLGSESQFRNAAATSAAIASVLSNYVEDDSIHLAAIPDECLAFLRKMPDPTYIVDSKGRLAWYNGAAATLWGWFPPIQLQRWCGSWNLESTEGNQLRLLQCAMAKALLTRKAIWGECATAVTPALERRTFASYPLVIVGGRGEALGGVNVMIAIPQN